MRSLALKTLFSFTFVLALLTPSVVFADTLFISPLNGTYAVGDTVAVRVMVTSPRQAVNAISGVLSFPPDKLQVISVSKIGSVLSLWVQEPTYSNSRGSVAFEGVVPNPGFSESNGRVLTVNFRVVAAGSADIRLTSGSLLANDGYGTNVLRTLGSASYNIEERRELPVTPPAIIEPEAETQTPPRSVAPAPEKEKATFSFSLPPVKVVFDWLVRFLSIVIPIVALIFFLIHTTKRGVGNISALRRGLRKDLHGIDRLVEKSFDLLKEDVSDSIHILERARAKRKLTAEEDAIIHSLRQNLLDAERAIHQEVVRAEKDLGD